MNGFPFGWHIKPNTMDLELALKRLHLKIKFWTNYMDKSIFHIIALLHEVVEVVGNKRETDQSSFFVHSEWNAEGRQTQNGEKTLN